MTPMTVACGILGAMLEVSEIGPFRLVALLGAGGAARVHRAVDGRDGRAVVLKWAARAARVDEERFLREAALLARLESPHLVRCLEAGRSGNWLWMAMEDVAAETLAARVACARPAPGDPLLVQWLAQILLALIALHGARVVHRDLKPANVLVGADGVVRVADLGLAFQEDLEPLTGSAALVGSPEWFPAEVLTGSRADHRGDLYQWALIAYWLCAGALPFAGDSPMSASSRRCFEPVPPLAQLAPATPALLSDLVQRNLEPEPAHRHREAAELLADLMLLWPEAAGPISPVRGTSA